MKKEYRVRKNEDFQRIISKKKSYANRQFVVYYYPNELGHMRAGLSVSKKLGKAVERNKIKRQVRHMIMNVFNKESSCDYIVIVRKGYLQYNFKENEEALRKLVKKIK